MLDSPSAGPLRECLLEDPLKILLSIKVLLRQAASQLTLPSVIAHCTFQITSRFFQIAKAKQTRRIGRESAGARMLYNRRLTAGEIADRTITTPCILKRYARRFRAAKLAKRTLDVCLIFPWS